MLLLVPGHRVMIVDRLDRTATNGNGKVSRQGTWVVVVNHHHLLPLRYGTYCSYLLLLLLGGDHVGLVAVWSVVV